ncbi:putative zinc ribbon protein, partial [Providencia rettgeri]
DYHQTNQKTNTGKTLKPWPILVDHYNPIKPITEWYCVWCRRFYTSQQRPVRKCCPKCREGIYSIPASQVTENHSYFHYALNNQGIESLVRTPLLRLTDLTESNVIDEAQ